MMQAGDLHPNPGPYKPKFPCVLCDKAAKWNQRAVSCDECQGWFHVDCMAMSTAAYDVLAESSQVEWICCQCGIPNFSSSLFSNKSLELSNSFESLLTSNGNAANSDCNTTTESELPSSPLAASSPSQNKPKKQYKPKGFRKQLKVIVVNFQGLRSKTTDLAYCLDQHSPDIVIGTETHIDDSVNSSELFPPGYSVVRKDRDFGRKKGGVILGFKDDLIATMHLTRYSHTGTLSQCASISQSDNYKHPYISL